MSPEALWEHFLAVSRIPRGSGNEGAVVTYVATVASTAGLPFRIDRAGNIIVKKRGARGPAGVALQSHLDMVCEKREGSPHDFEKDPLVLVRDGPWIKARDTTLGADNGIGVAAMLAIMTSNDIVHPDLELVFTVDEEAGLVGAQSLERQDITSRTLINLDSEEEGTFCIGCAGGIHTELRLEPDFMSVPEDTSAVLVSVSGLTGGHSGVDIHLGRPNAIKLIGRFLHAVDSAYSIHLADLSGGTRHNVIPRDARALIHASPADIGALHNEAAHWNGILKTEYEHADHRVALVLEESSEQAARVLTPESTKTVIRLVQALPHGPLRFNPEWEGVVDTSTNLAVCRFDGDEFLVVTSQRSTTPSSLHDAASQVASIGELAGCTVSHLGAYPAWRPDRNSAILSTCRDVYREITGREPNVKVIHAGLECAVIGEKIKGLDMISLGPTIVGAHSPDERVHIESVARFWDFLLALLERLSAKAC